MNATQAGTGWEGLFWLVFERSSNPIFLIDEQRRYVAVNDPGLTLLGRSRGEVTGASVDETIVPSERARAARDWQSLLRTGDYTGTRDFVRRDGSEVHVEFAAHLAAVGSRRLVIYVVLNGLGRRRSGKSTDSTDELSNREREVVTLIALGHETGQIARELRISPETVRTHVRNAMSKLGAHTRAQLVAITLCSGDVIHPDCVDR